MIQMMFEVWISGIELMDSEGSGYSEFFLWMVLFWVLLDY